MNFNINDLQLLLNATKSEDEEQYKLACDQYIQFASTFIQLRNQLQQQQNELNQQQKQDLHFQITQILTFSINRAEYLEKRLKSNNNNNNININNNNININNNNNTINGNAITLSANSSTISTPVNSSTTTTTTTTLCKPIALHYLFHFCEWSADILILLNRMNDATKYYAQAAEYGLELISKYKVPFQSEVKNVLSKAESLKSTNLSSPTTSLNNRQSTSPVNSLQQQFNNLHLFTNPISSFSSTNTPTTNTSNTPTPTTNRTSPLLNQQQQQHRLSPIITSSPSINNNNNNIRKSISPTTNSNNTPLSSTSNSATSYSPTSPIKYQHLRNNSTNSNNSSSSSSTSNTNNNNSNNNSIDIDNFNFSSLIIPSTPLTPITPLSSNTTNSSCAASSINHSLNTSSPFERSLISTTVNGASISSTNTHNNTHNISSTSNTSNNGNKIKPITDEEIQVLKYTSVMQSGLLLYPWNDELDLNENFTFSQPFIDQQFNNVLSKEQLSKLYKWLRPHEIIQMKLNNQSNNNNLNNNLNNNQSNNNLNNNININPTLIKNDEINEENIVQSHVVTDCSFVASLCVAALYERKYKKKLITNSIYPQDPITGKPYYNPHGKYSIKIYFNGVARKVIIDDRLPVDINGNLLCSYSTKIDEFWISLMEKAYMKVNGGYQFPGSNSGIDLYALTGWIPEEVKILNNFNNNTTNNGNKSPLPNMMMMNSNGQQYYPINMNISNHQSNNNINNQSNQQQQQTFDKELLWKRMHDGFQLGKCLITISTGHLDKQTEELVGLYANHAYAILDVREIKSSSPLPNMNMNMTSNNNNNMNTTNMNINNNFNNFNNFNSTNNSNSNTIKRLIKVKNPWTKKGYKGPYSSYDKLVWTDKLKKELQYEASIENQEDDGIFWMNYESLLKYFQTVHFSWNPDLFPYTEIRHSCWDNRMSTLDGTDHYTMNGNPQFRLKLHGKGSVWIMLTKHFTSLDERDRDYLTFHIHRGSSSSIGDTTVFKQGMDRVFYNENTLIHKGRYSNDPHYRICLNSDDSKKRRKSSDSNDYYSDNSTSTLSSNNNELSIFRIVLSQHGMIQTIRYSLFCYSTVPCSLEPIPYTYKYFRSVRDSWTLNTCGGSCNQINTFRLNPQYLISLPNTNSINNYNNSSNNSNSAANRCISPHTLFDKTNLRFSLSCLQPLDINIMVFCNQGQPIHLPAKELMITSTGNYRRCFAMCKLSSQELTYFQKDFTNPIFPLTVVLSNFSGSLGDFEFRVESTHTLIELKKIV